MKMNQCFSLSTTFYSLLKALTPHQMLYYHLGMYRNSGPAGFQKSSSSGRNHHCFRPEQNSKTALFPNCFELFLELIRWTETISDYGEEIKVLYSKICPHG